MTRITVIKRPVSLLGGVLAAGILAGCAQMPFFGDSKPAHRPAAASRTPAALRDGIAMYNEGDFNGAIRRLSSNDIAGASVGTRVTALKYTAFSYCVTSRPVQCRQSFEKALRLDPSFDLEPGEHGHPLWGPVFAKAKKEK
ncbi:MAG: TssQ family T6SS-associated lipoprotein [Massilia sp.]